MGNSRGISQPNASQYPSPSAAIFNFLAQSSETCLGSASVSLL
ncbi:MAG TPA: hypothetical protein VMV43_01160 [Candidatus Nanopelagicaceae bacterium]|nr:hypothetical protein [Candidatus Nanopelagicaceae bacterium]